MSSAQAKVYLLNYMGPCFSCFAFFTNFLVIVTILNARKKHKRVDEKAKKQLAHLRESSFT
jgi:hypothetical protein